MAVDPSNGALHVWLSDCNDTAPADSSDTAHGDCQNGPQPSVISPNGGTSPTQPASPSSKSGNSPSAPGVTPSATNPVVQSSIPGITVPSVVTIGYPTIVPGSMPTSSGIASLQPLASQAAQLYSSAQSAIAGLASETSQAATTYRQLYKR